MTAEEFVGGTNPANEDVGQEHDDIGDRARDPEPAAGRGSLPAGTAPVIADIAHPGEGWWNDSRTKVKIAIIGLVGVIAAATIGEVSGLLGRVLPSRAVITDAPSETTHREAPDDAVPQSPPSQVRPADAAAQSSCEPVRTRDGRDPVGHTVTVQYTEGYGFKTRCGPGNTYAVGYPLDLMDGSQVAVACQERQGQHITDHQNTTFPQGYPREGAVWALLTDGRWVLDLYLSTEKVDGDLPPPGIPACSDLLWGYL
ncbi:MULTISPECIES: hypothetical protein [unclassified Nocardiopsis]|uniref:hypothetical protein n=1 Tax=Nocardiopsis TaxID=2013 RepID=UPI00387B4035